MMKRVCLAICIGILLVGCSLVDETGGKQELEQGTFAVTPSSLFETEELKKLEPHLDMRTGCVEVKYKGDKEWIWSKYEIWENGELVEGPHDTFGINIGLDKEEELFEGDVSISIKDNIPQDDFKTSPNMIMTTVVEGSSSRKILDRYPLDYGSSVYSLDDPQVAQDDEAVAVWALTGIEGGKYSPEETIEETAQKADWALVLKVEFR